MASGGVGDLTVDRRCRELSILGFGGLAGPIGKYESVDGLKRSIQRMLDLAEDIHFSKKLSKEDDEDEDEERRMESGERESERASFAASGQGERGENSNQSQRNSAATPFEQRNGGRWIKTRIVESI